MLSLRFTTAVLGGGLTTIATFWLMAAMISSDSRVAGREILQAVDFIRSGVEPQPPLDREALPEPPVPPQDIPEFHLVDAPAPALNLAAAPFNGLSVSGPGLSGEVFGKPYLGDQAAGPLAMNDLRIVSRTPPVYPAGALIRKTEGWVKVELIVDVAGQVSDARILQAVPSGVFEAAVLKAVRRWRFQPPMVDGERQSVRVTQKIDFQLER